MVARNEDLHGFVPDTAPVALLLIDVINDLAFEGNAGLLAAAVPMARHIAALKARAKAAGLPVIYVNDNFGRWQSDLAKLLDRCLQNDVPGRPLAELLRPEEDDYVVIKPKHSGFYSTTLDVLLSYLKVRGVILTGLATNICVLFTANDAYMRDYYLFVPADCVAANTADEHTHALRQMATILKADIRPSTALDLAAVARAVQEGPTARSESEQ